MPFDLVLRNGRINGRGEGLVDIGVRQGRIAAIGVGLEASSESGREVALDGRLLIAGFVETHIHLDKSGISELTFKSRQPA